MYNRLEDNRIESELKFIFFLKEKKLFLKKMVFNCPKKYKKIAKPPKG